MSGKSPHACECVCGGHAHVCLCLQSSMVCEPVCLRVSTCTFFIPRHCQIIFPSLSSRSEGLAGRGKRAIQKGVNRGVGGGERGWRKTKAIPLFGGKCQPRMKLKPRHQHSGIVLGLRFLPLPRPLQRAVEISQPEIPIPTALTWG